MRKGVIVSLVVLGGFLLFAAGSWVGWRSARPPAGASSARKILYYTCPMHPQYRSEKQGDCPSCGMRLVPAYAVGNSSSVATSEGPSAAAVEVPSEKQQLVGVRVAVAEKSTRRHTVRTTGRVAVDETRLYRLNAVTSGWVQSVGNNSTGSLVKKDEVLAEFYAPEFLGAQQAYLYTLGAMDRFQKGNETPEQIKLTQANIQQAADNLRNLGMSQIQVEEMARTRELTQRIKILSPVVGFVVARGVSLGLRFESGFEFYQIADLSRVWILADVFQSQGRFLERGKGAVVTIPEQGRSVVATASTVLPQFDQASRTLKVRLEASNPDFVLRPGMFVDVAFDVTLPLSLVVPADAVIDSGIRKTVFVERGEGVFEPREVKTGWRFEDEVEILEGLEPGERVVASSTFLIDSESRMRAASAGFLSLPARDPVCNMEVDPGKAKAAGRVAAYAGTTFYFCSDGCKKSFDNDPRKYVAKQGR